MKTDASAAALVTLDCTLPDAAGCLDDVYRAFAHHAVDWAWCTQCFGPDDKKRMRDHRNDRKAPAAAFSQIYFEHPTCSGGETTFLHWLPRGIELQFFSRDIDPSLTVQMFRLGLLGWPEAEKQALRRLFCRIALNWWMSKELAPLQVLSEKGYGIDDRGIGRRLVEALCALQVDIRSVALALVEIDTPASWLSLVDAFQSDTILGEPVYYVLPNEQDEAIFRTARAAMDRLARSGVSDAISRECLVAKWERTSLADPFLAELISDAELLFDAYRFRRSDAEVAEDENAIKMAMRCVSGR